MGGRAPPREPWPTVPKTLILLRHAKSAWDNPSLADFARPLSSRGRKAAPLIGAYLARHGLVPDLVLASSAQRVIETLDLVSAGWPGKPTIRKLKSLYLAMPREMLRRLQAVGREPDRVMLVARRSPNARLYSRVPRSSAWPSMVTVTALKSCRNPACRCSITCAPGDRSYRSNSKCT